MNENPTFGAALERLSHFAEERVAQTGLTAHARVECGPIVQGEREPAHAARVDVGERRAAWMRLTRTDDNAWPQAALDALTQSWAELYAASEREESLMEELSVDWESLQALYDLSADLQSALAPAELLRRILNRALSSERSLHAVLMIARDGKLRPRAVRNVEFDAELDTSAGLVASCVREQRALVLHGDEQIAARSCAPEPWANATHLALVPITTSGGGLLGLIAAWRTTPGAAFDSYLVRLLEALGQQAALIVESDRLNRALLESERLKQEIAIGSMIQQLLLIGAAPPGLTRIEIANLALPSQTVDGDFADLYPHPDGTLDLVIGDVMGKGIPAALLGAATKTHILRALADRALGKERNAAPTPEQIINRASDTIGADLITLERFVTLCYARIDANADRVTVVDCGHPSTLHYHAATGGVSLLRGEGLPLGVLPGECYTQIEARLEPGDVLLFYSDGVTEAHTAARELFGEQRLIETLLAAHALKAAELLEAVHDEVTAFCAGEPLADDFTCLAVRVVDDNAWRELRLDSRLDELQRLRDWLSTTLRDKLDGERIDALQLALTEAVANVIRHGYAEQSGHAVLVRLRAVGERLTVVVEDSGKAWSLDAIEQPEFDGTREGGFGVFIVRAVFEDVILKRTRDGRNCMTLTAPLRKGEER